MKLLSQLISLIIVLSGCCSIMANDAGKLLYYSNFTNGENKGDWVYFKSQGEVKAAIFVVDKWDKNGGENGTGAVVSGPNLKRSLLAGFGENRITASQADIIIDFKPAIPIETRATLFSYSTMGYGQSYFGIYFTPDQRLGVMFNVDIKKGNEKIVKKFKLEGEPTKISVNQFHKIKISLKSGESVQIFIDDKLYASTTEGAMSFSDLPDTVDKGYPIAPIGSTFYNNKNNDEPFTGLISEIKIIDNSPISNNIDSSKISNNIIKSEVSKMSAEDWQINNIPASFNKDKKIYIFGGRAQILTFSIKSVAANLGKDHMVKLEFTLPAQTKVYGVEALRTEKFERSSKVIEDKKLFTVKFNLNRILLENKATKEGEWKNIQLGINIPENTPEYNKLEVKLFVGEQYIDTYNWPMIIEKFEEKGSKLKLIRLGIWDYGISRCSFVAPEIIDFLFSTGINFSLHPIGEGKSPMTSAGLSHHSFFSNPLYFDYECDGKKATSWGYCSAQAVITHGPEIISSGIKKIVDSAKKQDNIILIDYEPTGIVGFSQESIRQFLKESGVSPSDFEKFQKEYAEKKYLMFKTEDQFFKNIYQKWITFRSKQDQEFIGILAKEFKKNDPSIKFEMSCHPSIGDNDISSYALGHNNGAMAKNLDAILPQIYIGYGDVAAKALAITIRKWKEEIKKINPECKLYPVLLIRYAAAGVFNSPERVHQQTIGAIAEGADGVMYYFSQQMNSKYYAQIAKISNELSVNEVFYQKGIRVDSQFKAIDMLQGQAQIGKWPGYQIDIKNPGWHYTAHKLDNKILLTLFNYSESNDFVFNFSLDKALQKENIYNCSDISTKPGVISYLVPPQGIGYVTFNLNPQEKCKKH